MKTKKQEELDADIRYFWSEFRTRDDAEDGSSLKKGSKQYKQPCDDLFKVSAVLEPTPWVAKFLDKRKRQDDMETDTDLSCCQKTTSLRSFGSDVTNAKNGQYFKKCNISLNF